MKVVPSPTSESTTKLSTEVLDDTSYDGETRTVTAVRLIGADETRLAAFELHLLAARSGDDGLDLFEFSEDDLELLLRMPSPVSLTTSSTSMSQP